MCPKAPGFRRSWGLMDWLTIDDACIRVQLGRQLAEGGFAFVYAAIDAITGARFVLKKVLVQVRTDLVLSSPRVALPRAILLQECPVQCL